MQVLIIFLLFLLPLIVLPFGQSYFEIPKVFIGEIFIFILALIFFFKKGFTVKIFDKKQTTLFIVLFLITLLHLIFFRSDTSLFGNQFRLQGIFLLWFLGLFCLISSKVNLQLTRWIPILSFAGIVFGSLIFGVNENGRFIGTLGEPNALAAAGIFLWPFFLKEKNKFINYLGLSLVVLLIILTSSRSAIIALAVQLIFIFFYQRFKTSMGKPTIITIAVLILSFSLPIIKGGGWFENRLEIWQTALYSGFTNAFVGAGFGNIEKALPVTSQMLHNNIQYQYIDSSHNFLLDFWVQGGLIGLTAILVLIFFSLKGLIKRNKKIEIIALLGLMAVMSFNPVSIVILIQFWWLVGQGYKSLD